MTTRDGHSVGAHSHPTAVLAIILVSYLVIVLDISIVITALPRIRDDLGFSTAELSWVHTLVFGGLLLLGARAGDILGRRRMFMVGLVLFTLASLVVGAALTASWLLVGRVLQGVGAATLAPSTLALLTSASPRDPSAPARWPRTAPSPGSARASASSSAASSPTGSPGATGSSSTCPSAPSCC